MANWRDTFQSKTNVNERAIRLAAEQNTQSQAQYSAINRLDVTSANKQVTSRKLLDAINSDGPAKYEALGIVRILINHRSGGSGKTRQSHSEPDCSGTNGIC